MLQHGELWGTYNKWNKANIQVLKAVKFMEKENRTVVAKDWEAGEVGINV